MSKSIKNGVPENPGPQPLRSLMRHQKIAIKRFMNEKNLILFMEMRLGKSLVAIRWLKKKKANKVLLLAPKSALPDWEREMELEQVSKDWITRLDGKWNLTKFKSEFEKRDHLWCLATHEMIRSRPAYAFAPWDALIVDESSKIRNPQAQITQFVCSIGSRIPYKGILSGLPSPESEKDYFTQFKFLQGNFIGYDNFWKFRDDYFDQSPWTKYDWVLKPEKRKEIRNYVRKRAYVLTRKQAKVGSRKFYKRVFIPVPDRVKFQLQEIESTWSWRGEQTKYAPVAALWMSRFASGFDIHGNLYDTFKILEVYRFWLKNLQKDKFIVWSRFNSDLEQLHAFFSQRAIPTAIINGETREADRKRIQDEFNNGRNLQLIFAQTKCMKFGVNLSGADAAGYFTNPWSCEERIQSEDRIVHAIKKQPLLYVDFISESTIDLEVASALVDKKIKASYILNKLQDYAMKRKLD